MKLSDNFFKKVEKKTNVDKNTILSLAEKLQDDNMKNETALRDVIKQISILTGKEVPKEKRVENAEKLGVNLDDIEKNNTGLIHAKAGAKIAETEFGLDKEICDAIAYHTTGKENMTTLQKIIYLADFTGIDRKFDDLDYLYKLCK